MKTLCLSLCLLMAACGADESPTSPEATQDAMTRSESPDAWPEQCAEGLRVCEDEQRYAVCDASGALGESIPCEADRRCLDGHCRSALCEPLEVRCASWTRARQCDATGLRWGPPEPCGQDEICHDGQCLTCVPNETTCASFAAYGTCSEDGRSFSPEDITSCQGGERCHEASGVCLEPTCEEGQRVCAGSFGFQDCLPSETRFTPETSPCAQGEICNEGVCEPTSCTPSPVLFLVDRTGAIGGDWQSFKGAFEEAQNAQPLAAFGFMPFPMAFGCPEPGAGPLPRFPIQSNADIAGWFKEVSASAGEAALQYIFETILLRAHEVFNGYAGRIILVSSGEAECDSSPEALRAIIEALRVDYDITTYVIGHRASAGPYEALDAAHEAGGSLWESWKETSYDLDLTQAVLSAMEGTPACAEATGGDKRPL